MRDDDRIERHMADLAAMRAAAREERFALLSAGAALLLLLSALAGCAYIDPYLATAHAVKEDAKAHLAVENDHYAADVAALPRTIPAGALARMPAGEQKCSLAILAGLRLLECGFSPAVAAQLAGAGK